MPIYQICQIKIIATINKNRYSKNDIIMNNLSPSPLLNHFYEQVPKGEALDIGFGKGNDSIFLASKGFQVTAIDAKKSNVDDLARTAKENNLSINTELEDVRKFEFRPDTYEIITAMNSLFFLSGDDFKIVIENIKKSLKPGGIAIISSFTINDSLFKKLEQTVNKVDAQTFQDGTGNSWFFLKEEELKNMFFGFEVLFYKEITAQDTGHDKWPEPHAHTIARIVAKKQK